MPFPTSHQPPEPDSAVQADAEAMPETVTGPEATEAGQVEPETALDETPDVEIEDRDEDVELVRETSEADADEAEIAIVEEDEADIEETHDEDAGTEEVEAAARMEDRNSPDPEPELPEDELPQDELAEDELVEETAEADTAEAPGGTDAASNVVPLHSKGAEDSEAAGDEDPPKKGGSDIDDHYLRVTEALLFAAKEPLDIANVAARLPEGVDATEVLEELQRHYRDRGVVLVKTGNRWSFRTAPDLTGVLEIKTEVIRKLSRAAIETLAIVAYHQPVTRGEMEEVRGVALSRGTLDVLLEAGWIRPGKRRRTPGRPVTWVTTPKFLDHFGLGGLDELPGLDELKAAGLLDTRPALGVYRERGEEEEPEDEENQEDLFDETDLASNLMEAEET